MSSSPSSRFYHRVGFKLGLAYFGLFTISIGLLFAATFFILKHSLQRHDRDLIDESFDHYSLVYETAGLKGLNAEMLKENSEADVNQLLLRVVDLKTSAVVFKHSPKDFAEYDETRLNEKLLRSDMNVRFVKIPSKQDNDDELEVMRGLTHDGHLIAVGKNSEDREDFLEAFTKTFLYISIPCLIVALLGAVFFVSRVLRPVRNLTTAIREIESGNTQAQAIESTGADDLSELGRLFNRVWSKNQKLVLGMRESLDMIAHDLRTPLTRVRGFADEALKLTNPEQKNLALTETIVNLDEASKLLDVMLDISEGESGAMRLKQTSTSVSSLLLAVKDLYAMIAEDKQIELSVSAPTNLTANVDPRFKQVLANLVDNAIKYSKPQTSVDLKAYAAAGSVVIEIKDYGSGIPEADQQKIFQRLYRGGSSHWQPGLGLGLSLVASIIQAHDGKIEIADSSGSGTTFRITIPG